MKALRFLKRLEEKFSTKILAISILFILIISTTFTTFFIYQQRKSLNDSLVREGKILAKLLAHHCRIGVFSENAGLLKDPIEGILQQEVVLDVSIYNLEGKLLRQGQRKVRDGREMRLLPERGDLGRILNQVGRSGDPICLKTEREMECWSPVVISQSYSSEESLYFSGELYDHPKKAIGFVGLHLDGRVMQRKVKELLVKGALIGIIFLILGIFIIYVTVKGITNPLRRLTQCVIALGQGASVREIPVETRDEIGMLATAFNHMSESLRKREEEKEDLEKQLRHAQKMEAIGTLAGGIAHDFNNILTAIIGYANLLQIEMSEREMMKESPFRFQVDQILASAERAATLTKGLLAFSRKQIMNARPANLNKIMKDIEKLLIRLIGENIELRVKLNPEDLMVMADSGQIDQIMFNFVTNARDAMPNGGIITITTESVNITEGSPLVSRMGFKKLGSYGLITVSDTGVGMDNKTKERIFDPFFTTKEVGKGTGLGLSMAYGIVKQHHGYIDVTSFPDQGTRFQVYLPLIESQVEEEKAKPSPPAAVVRGGTETLLIAEDDKYINRLSKDIFERLGYKVISAQDGEDAVIKFMANREEIQMLLLDVMMPKKNGKEAYEEIKKMKPGIKTLFMSGYDYNVIGKTGVLEGGMDIITKPVSPDMLLRKVRELLDAPEVDLFL